MNRFQQDKLNTLLIKMASGGFEGNKPRLDERREENTGDEEDLDLDELLEDALKDFEKNKKKNQQRRNSGNQDEDDWSKDFLAGDIAITSSLCKSTSSALLAGAV